MKPHLPEQSQRKGDEEQQRDVIGNQHRAEKGQQYQDHAQHRSPVNPVQQLEGQPPKDANRVQARDDSHQAKEQAQYLQVDITLIELVRRHQDH